MNSIRADDTFVNDSVSRISANYGSTYNFSYHESVAWILITAQWPD